MNYDYLLCGIRVRFEVPWPLKITTESEPFLVTSETSGAPDLTVSFSMTDSLTLPDQGGTWNVNTCYCSGDRGWNIWHCPVRGKPPYARVIWDTETPDTVKICCVRGQEHQIAFTRNLIELLGLELFLLRFDGLILHSSLVDWEGRGILFSAPSGTGKSTQARLWEEHLGSRTLNGDRAAIRKENGVWTAWGIPFAGTSGIYRNESVPIRALVLLRQGPENVITPVSPVDAFRRLLPECSARRWDSAFMDRLLGLLFSLISGIPVYQLECRPDYEAVALLRDTLLKEDT